MNRDGFVYFIAAATVSQVKIGWAQNPKHRLYCLQTGSPVKLEMLRIMPAPRSEEARLHERFASVRAEGEWFHRSAELLAFIDGLPRRPWLVFIGELEEPSWASLMS